MTEKTNEDKRGEIMITQRMNNQRKEYYSICIKPELSIAQLVLSVIDNSMKRNSISQNKFDVFDCFASTEITAKIKDLFDDHIIVITRMIKK